MPRYPSHLPHSFEADAVASRHSMAGDEQVLKPSSEIAECRNEHTSLSPRVLDMARPPGQTRRGPTGRPSTALELSSRPRSVRR